LFSLPSKKSGAQRLMRGTYLVALHGASMPASPVPSPESYPFFTIKKSTARLKRRAAMGTS
ncbi:MAG: hypothetical protein J7559_16920, partial [Cohnella sp.]|nr:hypothetical protein [Cohnella sp.]